MRNVGSTPKERLIDYFELYASRFDTCPSKRRGAMSDRCDRQEGVTDFPSGKITRWKRLNRQTAQVVIMCSIGSSRPEPGWGQIPDHPAARTIYD